MKTFAVFLILLRFDWTVSLVATNNVTVCPNEQAVLECTTTTNGGFLQWSIPGGGGVSYNSPLNIDTASPDPLDGIFNIKLTSVSNSGNNFTSTATTIDTIANSTGERSLSCSDALINANSALAFIIFKGDVSPVRNVTFTLINCTHIMLSLEPPNETPNCVTGYYIEYDGMLYSTTETSITVPVTNDTLNIYTVMTTNVLMRNSTARSFTFNATGPRVGIESLTYSYNNPKDINDTSLLISWNYTVPEISHIDITRLLVYLNNVEIANTSINTMSWSTLVPEDMNYTVTLVAYNCFGSSNVSGSASIPSYIDFIINNLIGDDPFIKIILIIVIVIIIIVALCTITVVIIVCCIRIVIIKREIANIKMNRIPLEEVKKL